MKTNWPICTVEYTQEKKKNTTMSSSMDVLRDYHCGSQKFMQMK